MSYIVRVVGYNAYWTGDTEPGKCWSTNITDSQLFDTTEEAQVIVDSGNNMEVVKYDVASSDVQKDLFDWDAIDKAAKEIEERKLKQEFVDLSPSEFVQDFDESIDQVDVEVIE